MRSRLLENWGKLPIVVPKVAFLGTFGTTIGNYYCIYTVLGCA